MKYKMGLWNYYAIGGYDVETMAQDFTDLGFNFVMSCDYNPDAPDFHEKGLFLHHLDLLHERNMKVIVCDARTGWNRLTTQGEEAFLKGVKQAVEDFGSHPAVYGFHIGDEPNGKQMDDMIKAFKIVKAAAPHLYPFVNFLPLFAKDDYFEQVLGVPHDKYGELIDRVVKEAGIELLCYDFYRQCTYFNQEQGEKDYFENLRLFGEIAKRNDIPFFTTLLSVGHWNYRIPDEDDIRWQISTAVASGVTGILWFYVYARNKPEESFRNQPVDLFNMRTETFGRLARQNRIFMEFCANQLEDYEYVDTYAVGKEYGGFKAWTKGDFGIDEIELTDGTSAPLLLARFHGDKGYRFVIVNCERKMPAKIKVVKKEGGLNRWFAPGQMAIFD